MKQTTSEWLHVAEDDLLAAKALLQEDRLANLVAFHCQQCLEKCFKAVIEEKGLPSVKSHDLLRLLSMTGIVFSEEEMRTIRVINEVYIDSRYPGDLGLLPQGNPTFCELESFISISESAFFRIRIWIENPHS